MSRILEHLPTWLAAAATATAVLAIGGTPLWARLAVGVLAAAALGAHLWQGGRLRAGLLGGALALAVVWTLVQCLPLPAELVAALSPMTAATYHDTARAWGAPPPAWHPLSLDPGRTAAVGVSWFAAWALCAVGTRGRQAAASAPQVVVGVALGAALLGVVHLVADSAAIYGLYEPSVGLERRVFPTSFVNDNHAAALFVLAVAVALGQGLRPLEPARPRWLGAAVALSAAVCATGSRANQLVLGALWLAALVWEARRHRRRPHAEPPAPSSVAWVAGALGAAAAAIALVGAGPWLETWAQLGTPRAADPLLETWRVGGEVVSRYPWVGTGHGAFGAAAAAAQSSWTLGFVDQPHNLFLHALAEWGMPVALALLLLAGVGLGRGIWRVRSDPARLFAGLGLSGVAAGNLVDFSLWIPGVAVPCALLAGWLLRGARAADTRGRGALRLWPARLLAIACGGLLALGVAQGGRPPADFRLLEVAAVDAARRGEWATATRLADRAVTLAPSEPGGREIRAELALLAGQVARAAHELEALAGAHERGPERAAALIVRGGHAQALLALYPRRLPAHGLVLSDALYAAGQAELGDRVLESLLARFEADAGVGERCATRWAGRPERIGALSRAATRTLGRVATQDDPGARAALARTGYLLEGLRADLQGEPEIAHHLFLEAAASDPARAFEPLAMAAQALVATRDWDGLAALLPRVKAGAQPAPARLASYYRLRSHLEESEGDLEAALASMRLSLQHQPQAPWLRERLASLVRSRREAF